jgi:hypothetical protein
MQPRRYLSLAFLSAALLSACADDPTAVAPAEAPTPPRVLGLVELTVTGIGTPQMSASVAPPGAAPVAGGPRLSLSGMPSGTIQFDRLSANVVDVGVRGAGGQRYIQAVFQVRNADAAGNAYGTPRANLTFVPVGTAGSLAGTPVSKFLKQDATPANAAMAAQLRPTGAVGLDGGGVLTSQYPDVLQAFTEAEAEAFPVPAGVTNTFPYGFVVRHATSTSTRTLPANPAPGQWDGRVTFAYRLPLAATAAEDPFTISILAVAMDNGQTRITQSLEEQGATPAAVLQLRADALGASQVRLISGGFYGGVIPQVQMCGVRTAGTRAAPLAYLGTDAVSFASAVRTVAPGGAVVATFGDAVRTTSGAYLHASQSAASFLGGGFSTAGSTLSYGHAGAFAAGEELEMTFAAPATCTPAVARVRVGTAAGAGAFPGANFAVAGGPNDVATGDLNGDGIADMVVSNMTASGISVLLGTGGGGFGAQTFFATTSIPRTVALGDVNGDGKLDVAVGTDSRVSVFIGNGAGGLAAPADYTSGGLFTGGAALGDMDGDGDLDLVATGSTGDYVALRLNDGTGTFGAAVTTAVAGRPSQVHAVDVDGDGDRDVVTLNFAGGSVSVLANDGAGNLGTPATYPTGSTPRGIAIGDVNGDGRPDVVTANDGSNTVTLLVNGGGGAFAAAVSVGSNARDVKLSDITGDGALDLVLATGGFTSVRVLPGNGAGAFGAASTHLVESLPTALGVADVNADGRPDVLSLGTSSVTLLANTGTSLEAPLSYGTQASPRGTALADLNGDGMLDLATVNTASAVVVRLGQAGGTHGAAVSYSAGALGIGSQAIAVGDVDNDGRLDVAVANRTASTVSVLLGNGAGGLGAPTAYAMGTTTHDVELGDLDADGDLDLVTVGQGGTTASVRLNNGNGTFGAASAVSLGAVATPTALELGDVNGDYRLDLVVAAQGSDAVVVLLGAGTGAFAAPVQFAVNAAPRDVALGDVDGDGDLDIATASSTNSTILRGNGAGQFPGSSSVPMGLSPIAVALADVNGDGFDDFVAANNSGNTVSVRLSNGAGGFGPRTAFFVGFTVEGMALGDVNGDGRLDVAATVSDTNEAVVLRGRP